jgi:hypothetical protein
VYGNPVRYIDPTGHGTECGFGESCVVDPYTSPILPIKTVNNTGNAKAENEEDDFYFRIGNEDCDEECQNTLKGLFVVGTMLDTIALGLNATYAIVADMAFFVNPLLYADMIVLYQGLSVVPNVIGSFGGLTWIASGFISGENYLEISDNNGQVTISGSLAQDTITTFIVDGGGWFLKEPNLAASANAAGVIYDIGRNPFDPFIPTFFQPSFEVTFNNTSLVNYDISINK